MKKQKQITKKNTKIKKTSTNGQSSDLRSAYQDGRCVFCGGHECNDENPCKWRKQVFKNGGYGEDELNSALQHVQDIFDRITLPYFLLGDAVEAIVKRNTLSGVGKIEVGVEQKYLIPEVISSLNTYIGNIKTDYGYGYMFDKIPVEIKVITRKYKFFKNPDTIIYKLQDYKIPNPIDDYLKARWIIR